MYHKCPFCGETFCYCEVNRAKREERHVVQSLVRTKFVKIEQYRLSENFVAEGTRTALHVTNGQKNDGLQEVTLNADEQVALAQVIAEKQGMQLVYK